jgi:hypothetical protein
MLSLLNFIVRLLFAWPLMLIGIVLVHLGGGFLILAQWCIDRADFME